ncbi:MAG: hypothetical protein COA58_10995 [Bacteroidetes bacterium]|nr:MAG: hypothetical protein COA58_10995 [Bacteroidota bacterium]
MKKIFLYTVLSSLCLAAIFIFSSCEEEFCVGYASEPMVIVYSDSIPFTVKYSNKVGVNGTIKSEFFKNNFSSYHQLKIPFDMNANAMIYSFYDTSYLGDLKLNYGLTTGYCSVSESYLLVFDYVDVDTISTFKGLYSLNKYGYSWIDSLGNIQYSRPRIDSIRSLNSYLTKFGDSNPRLFFQP